MAAEEYRHTSFQGADCEFMDGEVVERNMGELPHSTVQMELGFLLRQLTPALGIQVKPEIRIQITPTRFRVADLAVWRPSTGTWWVRGIETVQWGKPGDVPAPADYNGDGRSDLAVWRPSTGVWWVHGVITAQWGKPGDVPAPGRPGA